MRHSLALAMLAQMSELPDRQRQRGGDIVFRLPDRQAIAFELLLIGRKVHQVTVAGAQRRSEQPVGLALAHVFDLGRRRPAALVGIGRRLWQQAVVARNEPAMLRLQGSAGADDLLLEGGIPCASHHR